MPIYLSKITDLLAEYSV